MDKHNEQENKKRLSVLGSILLFITAVIWGLAFVAQSKGMESVGPFTFIGLRSVIAAVMLIPWIVISRGKIGIVTDSDGNAIADKKKRMLTLFAALTGIGIVFFLASASQQIGMVFTDNVGKAGFITAMYIVLVPVAGIFMKKKPGWIVYPCVAVATFGLYLLCIKKGSFTIQKGDVLIMVCAVLFTGHIILIDTFSARINGVLIAFSQFVLTGLLGCLGMFLWEKPTGAQILDGLIPILYAGILSSGVGYTLQILGQKYVEPTRASLIMCLESVFSVLGGWIILHQSLTLREGIGCVIMFTAIIVCQVFGSAGTGKKADSYSNKTISVEK